MYSYEISYKENIDFIDSNYESFIMTFKNNKDSINPFKETTYFIIEEIDTTIKNSLSQKLMLFTILSMKGIENNELVPEVESLIKELIQNNTLEQVKSEISQEDYELIKKDIEFIREKLKI